jgi:hypothetical protein
VALGATASDNVGVTKVEFYVDGTRKTSDSSSPYSYNWKVPAGAGKTYALLAKAYDRAGNTATSSVVVTTP